jgi:hypothetical protein
MTHNGNGHNGGARNFKRLKKHELRASDEELASVTPLVDAGEQLWQAIGMLRMAHESDASAEGVRLVYGKWYEDIGVQVKRAGTTVGKWCNVYAQAGELCSLYPEFGFAHFELFLTQAKREDVPVDAIAERWNATADEYGGRPVPVSVVRAALKGTKPTADERFAAAVKSLASAAERMTRAVNDGARHRDAWRGLMDAVNEAVTALCEAVNEDEEATP